MTHIAIQQFLDSKKVDWMEKVSDKQRILVVGDTARLCVAPRRPHVVLSMAKITGKGGARGKRFARSEGLVSRKRQVRLRADDEAGTDRTIRRMVPRLAQS